MLEYTVTLKKIQSKIKNNNKDEEKRDERKEKTQSIPIFCQGILVKKSKETKGADGWRWS